MGLHNILENRKLRILIMILIKMIPGISALYFPYDRTSLQVHADVLGVRHPGT